MKPWGFGSYSKIRIVFPCLLKLMHVAKRDTRKKVGGGEVTDVERRRKK